MSSDDITLALAQAEIRHGRLRTLLRHHPMAAAGATLLILMIAAAALAPWLGTVDPQQISPIRRLRAPSAMYWFGTDMLGRDVYSRVIYGARISIVVGLSVALLSAVMGVALGTVIGFVRGLDAICMRVMDGIMSIPSVLVAIALMSLTRASVQNVVFAITIAEIPRVTRLVRSIVLTLREQLFVDAAVAAGTRPALILWRHIVPNVLPPVLVQASFIAASAMITEASLSFIGAGTPANIPSWGSIMAEGRAYFQIAFHIILFPGIFLALSVLSINLLGDGLREALDPRLARRM